MTAAAHRFVEHTGEVELALRAPTRQALFAEAIVALGELVADGPPPAALEEHVLEASGADDGALLAAWLDEAVFLIESAGLLPADARNVRVGAGTATGTLRGRRGTPRHLVKGITYHHLAVAREAGGWRATVVVDV